MIHLNKGIRMKTDNLSKNLKIFLKRRREHPLSGQSQVFHALPGRKRFPKNLGSSRRLGLFSAADEFAIGAGRKFHWPEIST
jgi:hypothetical protein